MNHRTCSMIMLLFALSAAAAPAQSPQRPVRASELKDRPFHVGGLLVTVSKLDGYVAISADIRDTGVGYIVVRVENATGKALAFQPNRLALVGKDGRQASV